MGLNLGTPTDPNNFSPPPQGSAFDLSKLIKGLNLGTPTDPNNFSPPPQGSAFDLSKLIKGLNLGTPTDPNNFSPFKGINIGAPAIDNRFQLYSPPLAGSRFQPYRTSGVAPGTSPPMVSGNSSGQNATLQNVLAVLRGLQVGRGVLSFGNTFLQSPDISGVSQGLGAVGGLASAGLDFSQGRYVPGAIALARSAGQAGQAAGNLAPGAVGALGTLGGALGGVAGLAGLGYAAAQGNESNTAGAIMSVPGALGGLANLAPASWTLAGIPISATAGTQAGTLAAEGLGTTVGGSLGGALGGIGAVIALPQIIQLLTHLDQFKKPGPPEGANWSDYKSLMTSRSLADQYQNFIAQAKSPQQLLSMAMAGNSLAPSGEVVFTHDQWGAMNRPENQARLAQAMQTPEGLRDFISGIHIRTGATGATQPNYQLTDWYRRQLASLSGIKDPTGLFQPDQAVSFQDRLAGNPAVQGMLRGYEQNLMAGSQAAPSREDLVSTLNAMSNYAAPGYQDFGGYSALYRDPNMGRLSPEQVTANQAYLQNMINNYRTFNYDTGQWKTPGATPAPQSQWGSQE